jgi:hypothetical protein
MSERITKLHIERQTERLGRNLGVRVAAGQSDYKVWRCHVGSDADTNGNGFTIAVAGTARELYDAMYAANNALEFVNLMSDWRTAHER